MVLILFAIIDENFFLYFFKCVLFSVRVEIIISFFVLNLFFFRNNYVLIILSLWFNYGFY